MPLQNDSLSNPYNPSAEDKAAEFYKLKVFHQLPRNEWEPKRGLLNANCYAFLNMTHDSEVLNCNVQHPSNVFGDLTNRETCYFCQLAIYRELLDFTDESKEIVFMKSTLSFFSAFCCYVAGAFLLLNAELRRTRPYPMIALSLLTLGSLLQLNYSQIRCIEGQLLSMLDTGMFTPLKGWYKLIGIVTQNASMFQ